jgi:hypothetical protein
MTNYCFLLILFSHTIPCKGRREILVHVNVGIDDHITVEVNLAMLKKSNDFRDLVTNEADGIYLVVEALKEDT